MQVGGFIPTPASETGGSGVSTNLSTTGAAGIPTVKESSSTANLVWGQVLTEGDIDSVYTERRPNWSGLSTFPELPQGAFVTTESLEAFYRNLEYFYPQIEDTPQHLHLCDITTTTASGSSIFIAKNQSDFQIVKRGAKTVNSNSSGYKVATLIFGRDVGSSYTKYTPPKFILKLHLFHDGGSNNGFAEINVTNTSQNVFDSRLYPLNQGNGNVAMVPLKDSSTSGDIVHTEIYFYYNNLDDDFNIVNNNTTAIQIPISFSPGIRIYGSSYIEIIPLHMNTVQETFV